MYDSGKRSFGQEQAAAAALRAQPDVNPGILEGLLHKYQHPSNAQKVELKELLVDLMFPVNS